MHSPKGRGTRRAKITKATGRIKACSTSCSCSFSFSSVRASRLSTRQAKIDRPAGPRLANSDELLLQATYYGSDVHDGCHTSFDKLLLAENPAAYGGA
jgi:hypothetical protein